MGGGDFLSLVQAKIASFSESGSVWAWLSGLGPARNALPEIFGRELVVIFSGETSKRAFPYLEADGELFALVSDESAAETERRILAGPIVQIWTDDGWYSAEARILSREDQAAFLNAHVPAQLYGSFCARFLSEKPIARVVSLRRIAACTGKNGPGRYAWIWAALSFYLLIRSVFRSGK